jgi:hypothetical protein
MRKRLVGSVLTLAILAVGGCAIRPAPLFTSHEVLLDEGLPLVGREDLLNELSMYYGVPYRNGGDSFDGIDCSGLVRRVFEPLGVSVPRTVVEQFEVGVPISDRQIMTGDLVFFGSGASPDHVGIAVSSEEMVHASTSRGVVLSRIDAFAGSARLQGVRRIVRLR